MGKYENALMMNTFGAEMCADVVKNQGFHDILKYPNDFKFDLMIYDYTALPCMLGLLHKFNYPPLVGVTGFCNPPYTADIMGGERLGLTVKPHYASTYDKNMNIFERLDNGFLNFFESVQVKTYF
ncbi:hypothetical protein ACKWTF_005920 [Chironomus riparius]